MRKGLFITVEGIEGVGKSTNLAFIREMLESAGHSVEVTREPGGTPRAEAIRDIALRPDMGSLDKDAELLLMFAARIDHLVNRIRPALEAHRTVLCDRFTDATFAYQGGGRRISLRRIATLARWVHDDLWPDLTVLLDAPASTGLERARSRGQVDRIEQEHLEFFEAVRKVYLQRAAAEPDRFRIVDATAPLEEVQREISGLLKPLLMGKRS